MLNNCSFMGRLTKDAVTRMVGDKNSSVTNFTLAVNRDYVKAGEKRKADFIPVVSWNLPENFIEKYLKKGEMVVVSGSMETTNWTDSEGITRYGMELTTQDVYATQLKKD